MPDWDTGSDGELILILALVVFVCHRDPLGTNSDHEENYLLFFVPVLSNSDCNYSFYSLLADLNKYHGGKKLHCPLANLQATGGPGAVVLLSCLLTESCAERELLKSRRKDSECT